MIYKNKEAIAFAMVWLKEMSTTKINVLKVCLERAFKKKPIIAEKVITMTSSL